MAESQPTFDSLALIQANSSFNKGEPASLCFLRACVVLPGNAQATSKSQPNRKAVFSISSFCAFYAVVIKPLSCPLKEQWDEGTCGINVRSSCLLFNSQACLPRPRKKSTELVQGEPVWTENTEKLGEAWEFSESHSDDTNKNSHLFFSQWALRGFWEAPLLEPCTPSFRKDAPQSGVRKQVPPAEMCIQEA